jgi:hypothetical protein
MENIPYLEGFTEALESFNDREWWLSMVMINRYNLYKYIMPNHFGGLHQQMLLCQQQIPCRPKYLD